MLDIGYGLVYGGVSVPNLGNFGSRATSGECESWSESARRVQELLSAVVEAVPVRRQRDQIDL